MSTVYLGANGNYPSSSAGIISAITAGHRHLIFLEPDCPMTASVNLNSFTRTDPLILEGAGPDMTNLAMSAAFSAPVFQGGLGWSIILNGIDVRGAKQQGFGYTGPCCRFTDFSSIEINNSEFEQSKGEGMILEKTIIKGGYPCTVKW